jgi:hypothetical protein
MNTHRPPRLANWLLRRLRYFEYNEALSGDLAEEFAAGRSSAWYWRQTIGAIARGMRHNLAEDWAGLAWLWAIALIPQGSVTAVMWQYHLPLARFHWMSWLAAPAYLVLTGTLPWPRLRFRKLFTVRMAAASCLIPVWFWSSSVGMLVLSETLLLAALFALTIRILADCPKPVPRIPQLHFGDLEDFALRVELGDGRVISLRPEKLTESICSANDAELTAAMFGRSASLEVLRRALWLGSLGRPQPVPVADLPGLIEDAARTPEIQRAFVVG